MAAAVLVCAFSMRQLLQPCVGEEGQAILRLEARHINEQLVQELVRGDAELKDDLVNDIYKKV